MNVQPRRFAPLLLALLLAGALLATGAASADGASGNCGAAPPAFPVFGAASGGVALTSYDDGIEDVQTAPDICGDNLVTNDNVALLFALHIHDRGFYRPEDAYSVYVDADANPATGSTAGPGVPGGAELVVQIYEDDGKLLRWNGASFEPLTTQTPIFTVWLPGWGPIVVVDRADLGELESINLVVVTSNGTDYDYAPDTAAWTYTVVPFQLTPGPLSTSAARAGKPLTARMEVTESAFGDPLDEGKVTCQAKVGGRSLAGRGSFADDDVVCSWRVPKTARGKRLSGSIAVEFEDVVAKRSFTVRVKR